MTQVEATSAPVLKEAMTFLSMLRDPTAQGFVRDNLIHSFSEAVGVNHPDLTGVSRSQITNRCISLVDKLLEKLQELDGTPDELYPTLEKLSLKANGDIWFQEFKEAYAYFKENVQPQERASLLSPYFEGDSLVDIGCGKGDFLGYLASTIHSKAIRLSGIDVCPGRCARDMRFELFSADLSVCEIDIPVSFHTALILSVLHHIPSVRDGISTMLQNLKRLGVKRAIIEESVIVSEQDQRLNIKGMERIDELKRTQPKFARFLDMGLSTQHAIIGMTDVLYHHLLTCTPEKPFPFSYGTISHWTHLFSEADWRVSHVELLGFQPGSFNQVCKVLFILDAPES